MIRSILKFFGKLPARPMLVIRREMPIVWTQADARMMQALLANPVWQKFEDVIEDSVVHELNDGIPAGGDAAQIIPETRGMMKTICTAYQFAALRRDSARRGLKTGLSLERIVKEQAAAMSASTSGEEIEEDDES